MGMTFDPDFNNTHYIYVAYTYDANPGEELDRRTKITRFTYGAVASTIIEAINGGATDDLWNPGSVLVFRYEGDGATRQ
jgi:hypothetical protein